MDAGTLANKFSLNLVLSQTGNLQSVVFMKEMNVRMERHATFSIRFEIRRANMRRISMPHAIVALIDLCATKHKVIEVNGTSMKANFLRAERRELISNNTNTNTNTNINTNTTPLIILNNDTIATLINIIAIHITTITTITITIITVKNSKNIGRVTTTTTREMILVVVVVVVVTQKKTATNLTVQNDNECCLHILLNNKANRIPHRQ
jgi:hypothetical protein